MKASVWSSGWRVVTALALGAAAQVLVGCNGFFVYPGTTTTSTGTANTGDFAYVSNPSAGNLEIAAYSISSTGLTAITGSPFNVGYVPVAMKVAPSNGFLYVATGQSTTYPLGLYRYTISTTGVLSNATQLVPNVSIASMDISPDGNYLYTIDTTGTILTQYTLNTSTGAYTAATTTATPGSATLGCAPFFSTGGSQTIPASQSCTVAVSPSGTYLGVALGNVGVVGNAQTVIFPYSSTAGITASEASIPNSNPLSGDFSIAFDMNNYLYIARTSELTSYTAPYVNGTTPTQESNYAMFSMGAAGTTSPIPRSVVLSKTYTYLYTADEGTSTISAFSLAGAGQLTAINNAISGPTNVSALGVDNSGNYLLAAGYNTNSGLQLFSIASTGLTSVGSTQGTGSALTIPVVMALSH